MVFFLGLQAFGQKEQTHIKCEEYPAHIDSMFYNKWNAADSTWVTENLRHYFYEQDDLSKLLLLNGSTRDSVWQWNYFYNEQGINDFDLLVEWEEGILVNSQKKESDYNEQGKIINELISSWSSEQWNPGSYWIYEYQNGILSRVIWQLRRKDGIFYDYQYRHYSYQNGLISQLRFERVSDGLITNIQDYSYNAQNKVSQIIYTKIDPASDKANPVYINDSRRSYFYNNYGLWSNVLFEICTPTGWTNNYNYLYFYRIDQAKKVAVCHNGNSICVSKNAVPALLAKGATLGRCEPEKSRFKAADASVTDSETSQSFKVYPNPVSEVFSLSGSSQAAVHLQLYNSQGALVMTKVIVPSDDMEISREDLPAGIYTLVISGDDFRQTERLLLK